MIFTILVALDISGQECGNTRVLYPNSQTQDQYVIEGLNVNIFRVGLYTNATGNVSNACDDFTNGAELRFTDKSPLSDGQISTFKMVSFLNFILMMYL